MLSKLSCTDLERNFAKIVKSELTRKLPARIPSFLDAFSLRWSIPLSLVPIMLVRIFAAFTFFLCQANSKPHTWYVDEKHIELPSQIRFDDLQKKLGAFGVKLFPIKDNEEVLFEDAVYKVFAQRHTHGRFHVSTEVKGISSLTELKEEHLLFFEKLTRALMEFVKPKGYAGYFSCVSKRDNKVIFDILPAKYFRDKAGEIDLLAKFKRFHFIVFDKRDEPLKDKLRPSDLELLKRVILQLKTTQIQKDTALSKFKPWYVMARNAQSMAEVSLHSIADELSNQKIIYKAAEGKAKGFLMQLKKVASELEGAEYDVQHIGIAKPRRLDECHFCNQKVVSSQLISGGKHFDILYNNRPFSEGHHFILTPKAERHIEDFSALGQKDVLELNMLTIRTIQAIAKVSGSDDIVIISQNGAAAGQRIPHIHRHVLRRPSRAVHSIMNLMEVHGEEIPPQTQTQIDLVKKKYGALLRG